MHVKYVTFHEGMQKYLTISTYSKSIMFACYRTPLALGYTRGHFCALIPPEPTAVGGMGAGAMPPSPPQAACNYLPLVTSEREVLPLHFTSRYSYVIYMISVTTFKEIFNMNLKMF